MTVQIDKDVPLSNDPRLGGSRKKWPWGEMEVGDSFLMKGASIGSASRGAFDAKHRYKRQFACRTVEGGIRIWRIA